MAKAEIFSGICGFTTTVRAHMKGSYCTLSIESECEAIQHFAENLPEVDPFQEITFRGKGPLILELAEKHCFHAACPVPVGVIKAVEIAAGLALPKNATIKLSKSEE